MHFHRDVLAIADTFCDTCCTRQPTTCLQGALHLRSRSPRQSVVFPMRAGAATYLLEQPSPAALLAAVDAHHITVLATAPTAYRAMISRSGGVDVASLRACGISRRDAAESDVEGRPRGKRDPAS